jgi:F1F0 ATPase subunit 2
MIKSEYMILAFIAGLVLGTLFFGGLWLTVKKAVESKNTTLWFLGSSFLRVSIVLVGFYYIGQGNWQRLLICVFGFIAARFLVIRVTRSIEDKQIDTPS